MNETAHILVTSTHLRNPHYTVLVIAYLLGRYRIQLTDLRKPDEDAPEGHGTVVRQLCTYHPAVVLGVVAVLRDSDDPEEFCRALETPYNHEFPGDRIRVLGKTDATAPARLDNKPGDKPDRKELACDHHENLRPGLSGPGGPVHPRASRLGRRRRA